MTDKHVSPAIGDFALEERAQLLARIARDDAMLRFAAVALRRCVSVEAQFAGKRIEDYLAAGGAHAPE